MVAASPEAAMRKPVIWRSISLSDNGALLLFGVCVALVHILVNGHYGFHRDELLTLNNACSPLEWGYVVYPPVTAFLARVEVLLFGTSLIGFRFFPAVAHGLLAVLTGLIARELGGRREAQLVAATAMTIGGASIYMGHSLSYTTFDFLWWVVAAYFVARLLRSEDARWWLAIGAALGLGLMTKYTMSFLVLGVLTGMALTPARRYLRSAWFWCGVAIACAICAPNLMWQARHEFASLNYMQTIHHRDIGRGWTDYFLLNQLWKCTNPVTLPLWCAGLWFLMGTKNGERFRMLGWMYVIPLVALFAARGRDYYMAPAYAMMLAAGAVWGEQWVQSLSERTARAVRRETWRALIIGGLIGAALTLPIAPLGSVWWRIADGANGNFNMEVGWTDLAETVANVRTKLPDPDKEHLGILAGDEGEAGAVNFYGPALGLPRAISGMNSNWMRGYGDPPPETLIVLGEKREYLNQIFEQCEWAARLGNAYGIENSALSGGYDNVFVCRRLREPWPVFWKHFRYYG